METVQLAFESLILSFKQCWIQRVEQLWSLQSKRIESVSKRKDQEKEEGRGVSILPLLFNDLAYIYLCRRSKILESDLYLPHSRESFHSSERASPILNPRL